MNDFEKIVSITQEKLSISLEFYDTTIKLQDIVKKDYELSAELLQQILDERQELIETVNILDRQFLELYEKLKIKEDFEIQLKKYPQIFQSINDIRENFQKSYQIDNNIIPQINKILDEIKNEIKKMSNQSKVSEKYGQEAINRLTSSNFGVFFDETK